MCLGGIDYNNSSVTVLFNRGRLSEVVSIGLINDNIAEPTEKFEIKIVRITSGSSLNLVGNITEALGIIKDDDGNYYYILLRLPLQGWYICFYYTRLRQSQVE